MQLYAFDENNRIVSITDAKKQHDYFCLECRNPVRRRGGEHRQQHFFHLQPISKCSQSKKSLIHIQVQKSLQRLLPNEQCVLEKIFPQIGRIADAVWEEKHLIFEVQCSGISGEEVKQRNEDYASLGYQVVWILHDKRFNRRKVTAAERALRTSPHYFTNMDAEGRGYFYDQVDVIVKGRRYRMHKPFPITLSQPKWINRKKAISDRPIPTIVINRLEQWPLYFGRDLLDCCLSSNPALNDICRKAAAWEAERWSKKSKKRRGLFSQWFYRFIARPYLAAFQIFLEKACRGEFKPGF
ncbi:MAG: competence protein CoiA family protein [Waddliaceae bacterium]